MRRLPSYSSPVTCVSQLPTLACEHSSRPTDTDLQIQRLEILTASASEMPENQLLKALTAEEKLVSKCLTVLFINHSGELGESAVNKYRLSVNYSNVGESDLKCLEITAFYNLGCCSNAKL